MATVGFIGTGIMGGPMACRLLQAGHRVIAYNRTRAKADALAQAGAVVADSVEAVARQCSTIFLMLSNDAAARDVVASIATQVQPRGTIVDCSTLSPSTTVELARSLAARDVRYIDAPVTGSRPQAEAGELTFLVGATEASAEPIMPLLSVMGKRLFFLGEVGRGTTAKAINNMVVAVNLAVFAEALSLAAACGLAEQDFLDVVRQSGARSAMIEYKGPKIVARDFEPHFALKLMHKDASLTLDLARQQGRWTPLLETVEKVYRKAAAEVDDGRKDVASVYLMYMQQTHARQL